MRIFHAINKVALAIILAIVIAVLAFVLTFVYVVPGTPKVTTSFSSTLSSSSTILNTNPSSVTGLQLVISFNSTVIRPGGSVNLSVSARNILSTPNNKSSASDWALPTLGQGFGPCTPLNNSPFRIAAFMGYYTSQNISQAIPLMVANPVGMYSCTAISQFVYLVFQPNSSSVAVYGCFGSTCETQGTFQMNNSYFESYFQVAGYYTSNSPTNETTTGSYSFHPLGGGIYTIAVGDEWGDLTLLHFTVTNSTLPTTTETTSTNNTEYSGTYGGISEVISFPNDSLEINASSFWSIRLAAQSPSCCGKGLTLDGTFAFTQPSVVGLLNASSFSELAPPYSYSSLPSGLWFNMSNGKVALNVNETQFSKILENDTSPFHLVIVNLGGNQDNVTEVTQVAFTYYQPI